MWILLTGGAIVYTIADPNRGWIMSLDQAVEEALATYNMSRSQEAEDTGRTVATLQD